MLSKYLWPSCQNAYGLHFFFQATRNKKVSYTEKSGSELSEESEEEDTPPARKTGGKRPSRAAKVGSHFKVICNMK